MRSRQLKHTYLRSLRKTRDFLLSDKSREFFVYLLFVLIAAGFWLLQTLDNEYETDVSIPVRLRGVPDNVVITSEPAGQVKVRVHDKGTALLNYLFAQRFYPVTLNFEDYLSHDNHVALPTSTFQRAVSAQLGSTARIVSIQPDTLEYFYSEGQAKRVPVRFSGRVSGGRQYYVSDTIFTPDSVDVYAIPSAFDTIIAAHTESIDYGQIEDTLHADVHLVSGKGVKFVPDVVKLTLPVDIYTEKTVDVPIEGVNFPADKDLRAFPSKVKVTFQVPMSHYKDITAEDFRILVSYEELVSLGDAKYTVHLRRQPQGITQIRLNPSQVDFIIEQYSSDDAN